MFAEIHLEPVDPVLSDQDSIWNKQPVMKVTIGAGSTVMVTLVMF